MLVSLYTVRVVLSTLGAEDYGIYNVVAGVVVLFSFVNNAMATSVQRYLNFALGQNDEGKAKEIFSTSLIIHAFIAVIFVALAETIGLWFLRRKLNIPPERNSAAFWAYQLATLTSVANILRVPYNAVIIAYEKMTFFAQISVLEAALKLAVVFALKLLSVDKLVLYSILLSVVAFLILAVYKIFCAVKFEISRFRKPKDKKLSKELVEFTGWSLFGSIASVASSQGTNIVLNMFTNVTVNAAMGIANQVNNAVCSFVINFQTAFRPQIVKTWAAGERDEFLHLIFRTAKISFLLLFIVAMPLFVNADFVLTVWLKNPPEHSVEFVQFILVYSLLDAMNAPLVMTIQAIGKIALYQIVVSCLIFSNLPWSILALKFGAKAGFVILISIFVLCVITVFRILYLKNIINFPILSFVFDVFIRCFSIGGLSYFIVNIFVKSLFGFKKLFVSCGIDILVLFVLFFLFGLNKREREIVMLKIGRRIAGNRGA